MGRECYIGVSILKDNILSKNVNEKIKQVGRGDTPCSLESEHFAF